MSRFLNRRTAQFAVMLAVMFVPAVLFAQQHEHVPTEGVESNLLLNAVEIITGLGAAAVAFQAALAYREGMLGKGMTWVAVGMIVMSVGHLILVIRRLSFDPLGFLGATGSFVVFSFAVFASFIASAWGFWTIRRAATSR